MANDLDSTEIVIKYDQVYTPNPEVCPGKTFPSFITMQNTVGDKLEAAEAYAEARKIPFQPYTVKCVLKPEFEGEKLEVGISNDSDTNA
ncbi:MAG: hypothetical protein WC102_01690 [Saccharofermentanales bacterium]